MITTNDTKDLKARLIQKGMPEAVISKIITYIDGELKNEEGKEEKKRSVTRNTIDQLYTLISKFWEMGLAVDGVNVVITGRNMAMVTFHGYKNKVLMTYPETEFDIQLVREGDTFKVAKESGSVVYTHEIDDPFDTGNKPIIGAYVVFKNKRGEFIETLSRSDFDKMKDASKQKFLWGEWESEFWLKSVIKRACKRHFYDVVEEIDKYDNDQYGSGREIPSPEVQEDLAAKVAIAIKRLDDASDLRQLNDAFQESGMMQNKEVVAAYKSRRGELDKPAVKTESTDENS